MVNAEGTWFGWSRFKNDQGDAGGFDDVLEWRLGLETAVADESAFRLGVAWKPSPVPDQTGRTNYVDNARWVFSAGGGRSFELWGERFRFDAAFQFHGLLQRTVHKHALGADDYPECGPSSGPICDEFPDPGPASADAVRQRSAGLQTGNPGFPGYRHGGYIIGAGMDIQWNF